MDEAIVASLFSGSNLSHRAITRAHRVPPSTLGHRLRGRADRSQSHASQARLSKAEKDALAQAVEQLCDWHWAPSRPCMRSMAEDLLRTRTGNAYANLGINWPNHFLCRQSGLKTTWSQALANSRAAAASPANITAWMEKLWAHWDANKLSLVDVWNFDEKGIQAGGIHRLKIVVRKTRINFDQQRRGPGDRKNLTLIKCCSAVSATWPSFNYYAKHKNAAKLGGESDNTNK